MTIEVTHIDIQEGVTEDCVDCPIACAMKRAGLTGIWVSSKMIQWRSANRIRSTNTPSHVASFIRRFDKNRSVSPITFELPD